ncbi:MAG: molybdopterin oxidoreductase family protein [Desulfobacca sp.]|uniref:molybdopterin oxidoreductase family protein n=1 Tax=Desulfobacca sp. TaxID=2067990 RepID=UPI00404B20FF
MLTHIPVERRPGSGKFYDDQIIACCQECAVGCGLVAFRQAGRIVDLQGWEGHPISQGRLCGRGRAVVQELQHPQRLLQPTWRQGPSPGTAVAEAWQSAMDRLAQQLRQVRDQHGPESLLIGCDAEGGLDFYIGALRFAQLWGTRQVVAPWGRGLDPWPEALNSPAKSCQEWPQSRCLLCVEADLADSHPVAWRWIQAAQQRGAVVVALDARFSATLAKADYALRLQPGTGNLVGIALLKLLLAHGGTQPEAIRAHFGEAQAWRSSYENLSLTDCDKIVGLAATELAQLACYLRDRAPVTIITGRSLADLPGHRVWLTLALATGWAEQPGGGWYPLDAGMPAWHLHTYVREGKVQGEYRRPPHPHFTEWEREVNHYGRAIICSGDSLAAHLLPRGLADPKKAELVVHFGRWPNQTWELAQVSFPAVHWSERDGLMFTNDRGVQWGAAIVASPPECRSGLYFWQALAKRFGWEAHFPWITADGRADRIAFFDWLLQQHPLTTGLTVAQLQSGAVAARCSWPVKPAVGAIGQGADASLLQPLAAPASLAPASSPDLEAAYPLLLVKGPRRLRPGGGRQGLAPRPVVLLHPQTAAQLGVAPGDAVWVELATGGGLAAWATVSRAVQPGLVAAPYAVSGQRASLYKVGNSRLAAAASAGS